MNSLRKECGYTNYNSIIRNCEFLENIGIINIDQKKVSKITYNFVSITQMGIEIFEKYLKKEGLNE